MPFASKAQLRAFAAKEKAGELPMGTFRRWLDETPSVKKLPERKKQAVRSGRTGRG